MLSFGSQMKLLLQLCILCSACWLMHIYVLCVRMCVCVCVLLRASHNCSNNKLLAIAFPFLYALRLLCAWLVPVLCRLLYLPVRNWIYNFIVPPTHTHARERQASKSCEWHLNINCFVFSLAQFAKYSFQFIQFPLNPCPTHSPPPPTPPSALSFIFVYLINYLYVCSLLHFGRCARWAGTSGCVHSLCSTAAKYATNNSTPRQLLRRLW